jgi:hypothetical protein
MKVISDYPSSCLVCTLHVEYSFLHKLFPLQGYCQHLNNSSARPIYKISKLCLCLSLVITGISTVPLFSYISLLSETCPREKSLCLIFLADLLFTVGSFVLAVIHLIKVKTYEKEANAWLFLFENTSLYSLMEIYSQNDKKEVKMRRHITFYTLGLVTIIMSIFVFCFPYDTLPLSLWRKWSVVHFFIIQYFGTVHTIQRMRLIGAILKTFEKAVKTAFSKKNQDGTDHFNLHSTLKKYRNFIATVNLNFALLMRHLLIIFFIFALTSLACLIVNLYILIKYLDYDPMSLAVLQLRTVSTIFGLLFLSVDADRNIKAKVSPIRFLLLLFYYCNQLTVVCSLN